jgi:isoquinoline 1-oxidoreductase beta subunit
MTGTTIDRRDFLKITGAAGASLTLGFYLPGCAREPAGPAEPVELNAWIRIETDGWVRLIVDRSEMGQGVATSLPMLLAEELEVPFESVRFEFAPADEAYFNPAVGSQGTGGSTSVRAAWEPLRRAGAAARMMLVAAAAERWGVPASECRAEAGRVVHEAGGKEAAYGELAEAAAAQTVPEDVALKPVPEFRLLGTRRGRLDTPVKTDGSAVFGIDVQREGLLVANVARCPVFGGRVAGYDDSAARAVPGVQDVIQFEDRIAVIADNYWAALQGRRALEIEWDEGAVAGQSSEKISAQFRELAARPGAVARSDGDARAALARAGRRLEAVYELPFLAHATMEPMNATADVRADRCEVWAPTQNQTGTQSFAAEIAGLSPEQVSVHTTYLGGGFGRRFELDFVSDALHCSKAVGAPVKVVWSREDDVRHDWYRPASYQVLRAGLGRDGRPVAWTHRMVVPSIMKRVFPSFVQNGVDGEAVEGAVGLPYAIPAVHVDYHDADTGVPVGFWRSVNHTHNAFAIECFIDELARAASRDPFEYRRELLADAPRHRRVLERAASEAGWGTSPGAGRGRGIAVHESFGSFVAQVADVSIEDGQVRVHRVVCAVDCGPTVNPSIIEAQIRSAMVYGLTAALYGEITIEAGRVVQGNFHDYQMLRIDEMPEVEVHIVESEGAIGGIGEVATPPIAPAVANAVFALTGQPVRRLPIRA